MFQMPRMEMTLPAIHILNRCTKYLARDMAQPPRHSYFNHLAALPQAAQFLEGWRFPIVDSHRVDGDPLGVQRWNVVTFVWRAADLAAPPGRVEVFGTFLPPSEPLLLNQVNDSRYWAATIRLPTGIAHDYVFRVDGTFTLDPINPRRRAAPDKSAWSFFWTDYCRTPVTFERWEIALLSRFTSHILPLNTLESSIFLSRLDPQTLGASRGNLYRFDESAGAVNFIDKLIAGPELHHRDDYKLCLPEIDRLLRQRNPFQEPSQMPKEMYAALYSEMGAGNPPGWNFGVYDNPAYFMRTLRRHTFMGAFSHPKYGGNAGGFAWDYLSEAHGPFAWREALEAPLGTSTEYFG
jgi:hypothetical protein